ncbi:hypothetical protein VUR80DRAFT_9503 [Thermomyces stellatus]
MSSIASQSYTPQEETEIKQWLTTSERLKANPADQKSILDTLDAHLASRTTLLGTKPSKADLAIYETLAPVVAKWSADERTGKEGRPNIVRLIDFVQNSDIFGLDVKDKVQIDLDDVRYWKSPEEVKAEKERLKKEKAAAAGQTELPERTKEAAAAEGTGKPKKEKKEKQEKQAKPQKAPAAAAPLSPHLIDLRVGHILKAVKHPEADSLYVSTIAVGDEPGTPDTEEFEGQVCRTVCSGLNGLVPLEEMQGRKVVAVCNLKPVKMRGIKSCAMVLAASPKVKEGEEDAHKGPVELVNVPEGATAGQRVYFEGWEGEPEGVLNPKKKVWETIQPGFTTTEGLEVAFDAGAVESLGKTGLAKLVVKGGGVCTVPSLKSATVR